MTRPQRDEAAPALVLDDVSVVRGGRTVWSQGTLTVPAGAVVGVIGPNGAGKTTLFQVALGLLPVAGGRVEVLGAAPRRGNHRIGYVPQNYTAAVNEAVRCRDLVTLGLTGGRFGLRRTSPAERALVDGALERVGAGEFADRRMSELSGGQQQRVAIARALVHDPPLLLADEPTAHLDHTQVDGVLRLLAGLMDGERVMVIATHDDRLLALGGHRVDLGRRTDSGPVAGANQD
jgi:zinc/manganese transport system ATP-binding protein